MTLRALILGTSAGLALWAASSQTASAEAFSAVNVSSKPILCNVGAASRTSKGVEIAPGQQVQIQIPFGDGTISCGKLVLYTEGSLDIPADFAVALNGQQSRILRAALFPYLPSFPPGDLTALKLLLARRFEASHPDVALELSSSIDPYDYNSFRRLFSAKGFDVVEIDTSVLVALRAGKYIVPVVPVSAPLGFAASAVAAPNGLQYGTPTWICRDFLFGYDRQLKQVPTLRGLLAYWKRHATRSKLVGDFTGRFELYAMYLNAYVARHGYGAPQLKAALSRAADSSAIKDILAVVRACGAMRRFRNPCAGRAFHNAASDGWLEALFAGGSVLTEVGFSERAFYMELWSDRVPTIVPMPYGPDPVPLMYVDALVDSASRCSKAPCSTDARDFARFMTSVPVVTAISYAHDLKSVLTSPPPRYLLPATAAFYAQPEVTRDPIYAQILPTLHGARSMPVSITQEALDRVTSRVCHGLIAAAPAYHNASCAREATVWRANASVVKLSDITNARNPSASYATKPNLVSEWEKPMMVFEALALVIAAGLFAIISLGYVIGVGWASVQALSLPAKMARAKDGTHRAKSPDTKQAMPTNASEASVDTSARPCDSQGKQKNAPDAPLSGESTEKCSEEKKKAACAEREKEKHERQERTRWNELSVAMRVSSFALRTAGILSCFAVLFALLSIACLWIGLRAPSQPSDTACCRPMLCPIAIVLLSPASSDTGCKAN